MKFFPISSSFTGGFSQQMSAKDLSGMLFERTIHMENLQKEFAKLILLPKKKKEKWLKSNEDFIHDMLQRIRNESQLIINEFMMNELSRVTVTEYMVSVQHALATLDKILDEGKALKAN